MVKHNFKYQNCNLKSDVESKRFFICSAFEIFYKCKVEEGKVVYFEWFNIGSFFISQLLDIMSGYLISVFIQDAPQEIDKVIGHTQEHKMLGNLDKQRFIKFLNKLKVNLLTDFQR